MLVCAPCVMGTVFPNPLCSGSISLISLVLYQMSVQGHPRIKEGHPGVSNREGGVTFLISVGYLEGY